MENPATWGEAERIVNETLCSAYEDRAAGVIGLSTARRVTDALRTAGLLTDEPGVCVKCGGSCEWCAG